jgi:hypothetical protein
MRRRSRALAISTVALAVWTAAFAAPSLAGDGDPTFYRDVLPILQESCQTCHRGVGANTGGMVAPMSLMTYDETRPWAKSIAKAVAAREMPPWFATEATRGQFHDERVLTPEQIDTITRWASTGAAAGDAADAPPVKHFVQDENAGWSFRQPDLVVPMPEPYFVADDVEDLNINFQTVLTEEQLPADTWFQGLEFRVGGRQVHHMCASAFAPGETESFQVGELGRNGLGCIALGAGPTFLPEGFAQLLKKGSRIRFSMHYHKEPGPGTGFTDRSELGFYFARGPVKHQTVYDAIGNVSFEIPPGNQRWRVGSAQVFPEDTYLLALWPHAHLRAVAARYELRTPDGKTELLLDVPHYDQEWQVVYRYLEPKRIPAGSRLEVSLWYENSPQRGSERGFDPQQATTFGPATTDEMMIGFLNWAPAAEIEGAAAPVAIPSSGSE